ncbi:MAG TPA: FAD:protein FMN transferase [Chromatiales bacterium]|nr:FAD:protein FMN transferase [Chromatiales bacterium]
MLTGLRQPKWIVALLVVFVLCGCSQEPRLHKSTILAFGTTIDLVLSDVNPHKAIDARRKLIKSFEYMHKSWHPWRPGNLSRTNELLATGVSFTVSPSLLPVIKLGQQLELSSDGLFNPAIGKLIAAWGFHRDDPENSVPPDAGVIRDLAQHQPSMQDIHIDGFSLRCVNPMVQIDMGGYAKGYGVDLALQELRDMGIHNAIINAGGDVRVIGQHGGRHWRVGIRNYNGDGVLATVDVFDGEAVFTSGDYERRYTDHAKTYHHIIDPRTGFPATETASVTVIHGDGATADAAATALFVAGPQRWRDIAKKMGIRYVLLVDRHGQRYMTEDMKNRLQLMHNDPL